MTDISSVKSASIADKIGFRKWSKYAGILLSLVILCVIFGVLTPIFFTWHNLINIALEASINGIIAIGMTLVIITAGIDLSVGSVVALTCLVSAGAMVKGMPVFPALILGLAVGALCGVVNGVLVANLQLQPFLVTLGTMSIFRGLALIYNNGLPITNIPQAFLGAMNKTNNSIPIPVIMLFVFAVIVYLLLRFSKFGEYIFAIGGNEEASRLSGVNIKFNKIMVYVISAIACTLAGLIFVGRLHAADPTAGNGYEMNAIAAAAVGGASLAGGKGSIVGTIIGALLLSALTNGLTLLNVQSYYQQVAVGAIIIIAVIADRFSRNR